MAMTYWLGYCAKLGQLARSNQRVELCLHMPKLEGGAGYLHLAESHSQLATFQQHVGELAKSSLN